MHFVLLGTHSPDICPTANARTRTLLLETAPLIPKVAEEAGVTIVSGPFVNREHTTVVIVEADSGEALDRFLLGSRLPQWNSIRIIPSLPMAEGIEEVEAQTTVF
jgi:hypothetical protein